MILLLLSVLVNAHASTVLIQSPQSSGFEYKAMLKAHGEYTSPAQYYLSNHPLITQREQLLTLFTEAQKAFLEKSIEEAKQKYSNVLELLTTDDWEKSDREIFLQVYLRLAQIETDAGLRDRWLGRSLLLGEANFDSALFPPPLIARREEMERQLPKKTFSRKMFAQGWNEILINGQRCNNRDCGTWILYPGHVRVTALSDQWSPQSNVIDLADIDRFVPAREAWAGGKCGDEHLSLEAERLSNKKVFWSMNCEKPVAAENINLNPALQPVALPTFNTSSPARPFYQNKWLWIGAAAVVAAVIITSQNQKKETTETSTTYGY